MVSHAEISEPAVAPAFLAHEDTEAALIGLARAGRMPHAILLSGRRGIGKATLAKRLARWLLAGSATSAPAALFGDMEQGTSLWVDPMDPVARRIASGGHADLLTVERAWDAKRKRMRGEIVAEDTRAVAEFFHMTPAEGGWRIAIIDGAEEMNRHAANAVLKILEEPPARCLLLLVTHNAGRLLPTIRSRCRKLPLQPLPEAAVAALMAELRPEISTEDRLIYGQLSAGSIGKALELADADGLELYRALVSIFSALPRLDIAALHGLADRVARGDGGSFDILTELLLDLVARMTVAMTGGGGVVLPATEAALLKRLHGRSPLDRWVALWENLRHLFERTAAVNLDRKQVVLNAFLAVEATAAS